MFTVEPPRWGNPIHTLCKQFEKYQDGTVFIRRPGGTHPATSAEHKALERRLLNRPPEGLEIVIESIGDPIPRMDVSDDAVEAWLAQERDRLLAPMRAELRRTHEDETARRPKEDHGDSTIDALIRPQRFAIPVDLHLPDPLRKFRESTREDRSPEDYTTQVDDYLAAARDYLRVAASNQFSSVVETRLALRVANTSSRNLESVEIIVYFPGPVFTQFHTDVSLPPPRTWGPKTLFADHLSQGTFVPHEILNANWSLPTSPGFTARNTGSTTIDFDPLDLRPHRHYELDEVPLLVAASLNGTIQGTWTATATNRDGQAHGTVTVALSDDTLDIVTLLPPGS